MTDPAAGPMRGLLEKDSRSFQSIYAMCFVTLAAIALVAQALGWHWRSWLPGAEGVESLNDGVKVGVYNFMSHLL